MKKVLILDKDTLDFREVEVNGEVGYEVINEGVEGSMESCTFNRKLQENRIMVWCNESGKIKDLKCSTVVADISNIFAGPRVVETLAGNLVFTKTDGHGGTYGLTDEEILLVKHELRIRCELRSKNAKGENLVEQVRILKYN